MANKRGTSSAIRVAALYDIHGNLPALEAVLRDVQQAGVDRIVVGGDVVPGPMPHETVSAVLNLAIPAQFIRGNGEHEVLATLAGVDTGRVPEQFQESVRWVGQELTPEYVRLMGDWPQTVQLGIPGLGEVLFCHATPRDDNEIFTRLTPEDRLLPIFEPVDAAVVICGHTHMQFDRQIGRHRVVNAGSIGAPWGEPGAYWLLLGPDVELRKTTYDLAAAAARIRATDYPLEDEFGAGWVLQPPSEAEMLEVYEQAALG